MLLLEIPTMILISWIAWRLAVVEKTLAEVIKILGVPINLMLKKVQNGEVTLGLPEKSNTQKTGSPTRFSQTEEQDL